MAGPFEILMRHHGLLLVILGGKKDFLSPYSFVLVLPPLDVYKQILKVPVTESESDFALDSCGSIKITAKPPSKEAKAGKSGRRETRSSGKSKKKKNQ